jgi:hypothetical protein
MASTAESDKGFKEWPECAGTESENEGSAIYPAIVRDWG